MKLSFFSMVAPPVGLHRGKEEASESSELKPEAKLTDDPLFPLYWEGGGGTSGAGGGQKSGLHLKSPLRSMKFTGSPPT